MKVFHVTEEDFHEGGVGICLSCGDMYHGVEPDAREYQCGSCDCYTVYGLEEALLMGRVDLEGDDESNS